MFLWGMAAVIFAINHYLRVSRFNIIYYLNGFDDKVNFIIWEDMILTALVVEGKFIKQIFSFHDLLKPFSVISKSMVLLFYYYFMFKSLSIT